MRMFRTKKLIQVAWPFGKFVFGIFDLARRRIEEFSSGFVEGWQEANSSLQEDEHRTDDVRLKEWP